MKKIFFILVLCLLVSFVQAQSPYSVENLQKLSQEELDVYYNKALKLQKTGRVFNIIGGTSLGVVGVCAVLGNDATFGVDSWAIIIIAGAGMIVGGTSFAIGIPTNLIGKSRVKRIDSIRNTAFKNLTFDLIPGAQYNLITQNYQPALTLRIRF